jgi:hypothetical protein
VDAGLQRDLAVAMKTIVAAALATLLTQAATRIAVGARRIGQLSPASGANDVGAQRLAHFAVDKVINEIKVRIPAPIRRPCSKFPLLAATLPMRFGVWLVLSGSRAGAASVSD